jgi:hypothetical protein
VFSNFFGAGQTLFEEKKRNTNIESAEHSKPGCIGRKEGSIKSSGGVGLVPDQS